MPIFLDGLRELEQVGLNLGRTRQVIHPMLVFTHYPRAGAWLRSRRNASSTQLTGEPLILAAYTAVAQPYSLLATEALKQLVAVAGPAHRMLTLLEMLVIPLQKLLRDDDPRIVERALDLVALLTTCDAVERGGMGLCGRALVPKFQKLCPTLNALRESMPQFEQKVRATLVSVRSGAMRWYNAAVRRGASRDACDCIVIGTKS